MNPRVRNMQKTSKSKIENINLAKLHFVSLYCVIILQCTVQNSTDLCNEITSKISEELEIYVEFR
jgi:hypothetical protein